jgi:hypothetical protein
MNTEVENELVNFETEALKWIDKLAEGARAIVAIASPIMEDIIAAANAAKGSFGESAQSANQGADDATSESNAATGPGLRKSDLAALLILGAIGCGGVYSLRRWARRPGRR